MIINCVKHGEVEADPNKKGDIWCPKCIQEIYNAFKIPKEFFQHADAQISMGCSVPRQTNKLGPPCPDCKGSGITQEYGVYELCPRCKGYGVVKE